MSRPSEPVEITSISTTCAGAERMIEPLPKARSIWLSAASKAFFLSTVSFSTNRKAL
jgi:hypothetical protein